MKIKSFEVENYIEKLSPFKSLILLYGPDEGLVYYRSKKITKSFLGNTFNKNMLRIFDFDEKNINSLNEIVETNSLFSKKEVIKIINPNDRNINWLGTNSYENLLILVCASNLTAKSKLRKHFEEDKSCMAIPCYKTDAEQLKKIIVQFANKNNLKFENGSINYLIENLGENYQIIVNELSKVLLLKTKTISYENVRSIISSNGSLLFEDIIFECLAGNKRFFKNNFNYNINDIGDASILLANTKRYLFIFGDALGEYNKTNLKDVIVKYMPRYLFKKKQIFTEIIINKSYEKIVKSIEILSEIEEKMRKNQNLYKAILLRGMLNIAQNMK